MQYFTFWFSFWRCFYQQDKKNWKRQTLYFSHVVKTKWTIFLMFSVIVYTFRFSRRQTFFYSNVEKIFYSYFPKSTLLTGSAREYCEWESFNATCPRDSVIVMTAAKYGRMALGRCVTKNYGHIGCGTDVMPHIVPKCSGRTSCLISVISLHNKRSCPKDFKSYLQAGYSCLKGTSNVRNIYCTETRMWGK